MKKFIQKNMKILSLIGMAVLIVAAVTGYAYSTGNRLKQQAYFTVQQNVIQIANEIEASVGFAKSSIQLTSQSATQSMTQDVIEDVNSILDPLLGSTPFNFIEYILADGWNTMNDGGVPFDASDREYYRQGIQGKTGIWVNFAPKKSKEVLLNFYTPLYYEGRIVGVFTGTLGGDTNVKPLLQSTFYGEEVRGFLCDSNGDIIASTVDDLSIGTSLRTYLTDGMGLAAEIYDTYAGDSSLEATTPFELKEREGNAICCVSGVKDLDWFVVQIVPAGSMANIMNGSIMQSILVVSLVIILFLIYFLYIIRNQKKKNEQQIAEHRGVMEVLGREYSSVYLIDTESGLMEPYRLKEGIRRHYGTAMQNGLLWDEGVTDYAKRFVREDYREEFLQTCLLNNLIAKLGEDGEMLTYEFVNNRDGEQHVYRLIASWLPDTKIRHIVVGIADINEEREKELFVKQNLQDAYNRAEAANRAKSAFLFNMSHDIRTPMNAILGFTNMLEKNRTDEKAFKHCLENIKISSNYLLNLINNVLDLARIESGKSTLDDSYVWDAKQFNNNLVTVFSAELEKKNLTLHRSFHVTHSDIFVDATKLEQVFVNILSNAVKYTPPGGDIYMTVTELPSEKEDYCYYRTVIEDTGIGMSEEFLPHIFDEFARERNTTESGISGTGLGMGITKKIVDLMDGTIMVESRLGKGTKVTICLPHRIVKNIGPQTNHENEPEITYDSSVFTGKRILLAEDNELNAEIAVELLKDIGFVVECAKDGIICVDMLEKAAPGYYDLILMDIQMPNMDGYKATQIIRRLPDKQKANIPILAMTANAFEEDKQNAFKVGMNGHISKPIQVHMLKEAIAAVLTTGPQNV